MFVYIYSYMNAMYLSNLCLENFEQKQVGHRQNDKVCNTFFFQHNCRVHVLSL